MTTLPPELLHLIIDHGLEPADLQQLAQTNRGLNNILKSNGKSIWIELLKRDFLSGKEPEFFNLSLQEIKSLYFYCKNALYKLKSNVTVFQSVSISQWYNELPMILKQSKRFLLECMKINYEVVRVMPQVYLDDKIYVLYLIDNKAKSRFRHVAFLQFLPLKYRNDYDVAIKILKECNKSEFAYLSEELKADKTIVLAAIQQPSDIDDVNEIFDSFSAEFRNDEEIILEALKVGLDPQDTVPFSLKDNEDFAMKMLSINIKWFEALSPRLRRNTSWLKKNPRVKQAYKDMKERKTRLRTQAAVEFHGRSDKSFRKKRCHNCARRTKRKMN